jgi:type I restriction enzyme R subunit
MTRITENTIEAFAIELLDKLGYEYIYAPDIAPDSENPERDSFEQVLVIQQVAKCY